MANSANIEIDEMLHGAPVDSKGRLDYVKFTKLSSTERMMINEAFSRHLDAPKNFPLFSYTQ